MQFGVPSGLEVIGPGYKLNMFSFTTWKKINIQLSYVSTTKLDGTLHVRVFQNEQNKGVHSAERSGPPVLKEETYIAGLSTSSLRLII